jgi:hypothetical protein
VTHQEVAAQAADGRITQMTSKGEYFYRVTARNPILEGPKRKGKKVLGPFSDLPLTQIGFTADIFPELLWLGMVLDRFGYREGLKIAMHFQAALYKVSAERPWYRLSEIAKIERSVWFEIPEVGQPFKTSIEEALGPIAYTYPELDIAFVEAQQQTREENVILLMSCVKRFSNRFETAGCLLIGAYIFLQVYVERAQVPRQLIDGINAIFSKPDSAEAEIASSSVRAYLMASWLIDPADKGEWPKVFWRANHRLSPCEVKAYR